MKKSSFPKSVLCLNSTSDVEPARQAILFVTMSFLLIFVASASHVITHGQERNPLRITSVSTTNSPRGTVVSISGDGPLSRAQTWQDGEGFHVVMPDSVAADSVKGGKGVKVRRVGRSIEIIVQTKPGVGVNVEEVDNRLNLVVDGKLENRPTDSYGDTETPRSSTSSSDVTSSTLPYQPTFTPRNTGDTGLPTAGRNGFVDAPAGVSNPEQAPETDAAALEEATQLTAHEDGLLASIFSGSSLLIVVALGLFGLLVSRKLTSRTPSETPLQNDQVVAEVSAEQFAANNNEDMALVKSSNRQVSGGQRERKGVVRMPVTAPASLFGAYRIDQEVGKLILGQPHRMDVLASRAPDDRRAIVTSLVKTIASPEYDETARRRAREALEEYGFVARECALLLMAADAFERTSAARSLGEIKSPAALPFLLEGLYDNESIVRNQAVISIGELKVPAAIGALLDMARRHPDVPSSLVSRALSACSVEGLDFFDAVPEPALLGAGHSNGLIHDITHLEPASSVEDLPESSDDERFAELMSQCEGDDPEDRAVAVKDLAQFQVQSAVTMLSRVARFDSEPNLRGLAISSLASINHESVFPAILISMADETREVRAAAARSLSRLSFDRADAYVRVMESADDSLLADVSSACIRAGIVSQNIERLASNDRRQAYEAFSLICLLAKAGMIDPVLEAICEHESNDVRLMAVHLLATTGRAEVFEQFQKLAVRDGVSEDVKTALLEAMYKMEEAKPEEEEATSEVVWVSNEADSDPISEPVTSIEEEPQAESLLGEKVFDERDF